MVFPTELPALCWVLQQERLLVEGYSVVMFLFNVMAGNNVQF